VIGQEDQEIVNGEQLGTDVVRYQVLDVEVATVVGHDLNLHSSYTVFLGELPETVRKGPLKVLPVEHGRATVPTARERPGLYESESRVQALFDKLEHRPKIPLGPDLRHVAVWLVRVAARVQEEVGRAVGQRISALREALHVSG
jgi:hypothetical protein